MPLSVAAPAKINLSLDITGTRDDGYHLVDTVMQAVSLCDTVTVWESDQPGISLELTGAGGRRYQHGLYGRRPVPGSGQKAGNGAGWNRHPHP